MWVSTILVLNKIQFHNVLHGLYTKYYRIQLHYLLHVLHRTYLNNVLQFLNTVKLNDVA
jgi:hypothetical protein